MKAVSFLCVVLVLCPLLAQANIWDNLFLGKGIAFRLPSNFSMTLSLDQSFGKINFEIKGSEELNFLSVSHKLIFNDPTYSLGLTFLGITDVIATYKVNFTSSTLTLNSFFKECLLVKDELFHSAFVAKVQQYITLLTLLVSVEKEGDFFLLESKKLLNLLDASAVKKLPWDELPINKSLIPKMPDLVFFFDAKTANLKKVEAQLDKDKKYLLKVTDLRPCKFTPQDLDIPSSWNCKGQVAKPIKDLDAQELMGDVKKKWESLAPALKLLAPQVAEPLELILKANSIEDILAILEKLSKML